MKNPEPCVHCGVPEADHSTDWHSHSYVAPPQAIDDSLRESLSEEGFRSVMAGDGTVSEVAAREGAASSGSGGASVLDRLNAIVGRLELVLGLVSDLLTGRQPQPVEAESVTTAEVYPLSTDPNDRPTTLTEDAPSNPEPQA